MLKSLTLVLAIALATSTAYAAQTPSDATDTLELRQKLAEEILEVTKAREMIQTSILNTQDIMLKDAPAEIKESTAKTLNTLFAWEKVGGRFVKIYTDVFTAKELQEFSAFYRSPMGKNLIEKQPEINQKSMVMMQELIQEAIPLLQAQIQKATPAPTPAP